MADIHLHIGLNKTGTSSIQDFFSMNAERLLREDGLCYPSAGRSATAHHDLSKWLKTPEGKAATPQSPVVATLLDELRQAPRALLSSEDFHTLGASQVAHLAHLLKGHRVRVVLYLREHVAYLASWYQQNVQATNQTCSFGAFAQQTRKPLHRVAGFWAESFGAANVTLRLYDRAQLVGGDVVQDLAAQIGLAGDLQRFERKPFESNPSVTGNLLFIKRLANLFFDRKALVDMTAELTALSSSRVQARVPAACGDADVVAQIVRQNRQDRQELQAQHGLDMPARSGELAGHAAPDLATLHTDWDLVMTRARERAMTIGRLADVLSVRDCAALLGAR